MALLNKNEFQKLTGIVPDADFDKLEKAAESMINPLTGMYYELHSIDEDTDINRVNWFKKALALQIQYMSDIGASSTYEMAQKDIKSVSIDGTSVSTGTSPTDSATNGVYNLALEYLFYTGLLYRGISSC
ncbi:MULTISPECIES: hypothetical protein [Lactobacillus]|jgi:hypothetical protein|uniref:DUF4054 domain-containing protein n=1 Tax=Lactobacillus gasseri TaxID=1596 RepID=A0AB33CG52_LACGS|nr:MULTISPECIES: hypothetical protein [Lactobacillus]ART99109.1 hypothetical protein CCE30_09530 [Lactobacillus gasseri]EJN54695.1 Hypothetical protein A131_54478 [Lactobacillus gasseri CECT 5714]MBV6739544.1 hypothetical protein [Lactobacillus gasseri CECT 5714]MDK7067333.1 hypothetical protein [Lactobacillus paragasseri]QTP20673.1 hypothetical protein J7S35_001157 [Lactobacillus gasseri]